MEKQQSYYLHAIMIHDGVAENGHYYTYIFDRSSKTWWKLNDHNVSMEFEEEVMKEAFGGEGFKSACNLVYMSAKIADEIDKYQKPVFTQEHADNFKLNNSIKQQIYSKNN